jgi:hypothetical protein
MASLLSIGKYEPSGFFIKYAKKYQLEPALPGIVDNSRVYCLLLINTFDHAWALASGGKPE